MKQQACKGLIFNLSLSAITMLSSQVKAQEKYTPAFIEKQPEFTRWLYDVDAIGEVAHRYRWEAASNNAGQATYEGFSIPTHLQSTKYGNYELYDVQPDEIVILAKPFRTPGTTFVCVRDSTGREKDKSFKPRGRTSAEEFTKNNNAIVADMYKITDSAMMWRRSQGTSGYQTFESFELPPSLSSTDNATFSLVEVLKDTVYVLAVSSIGSGSEYFRIDYTGRFIHVTEGLYRPPSERRRVH